MKVYEKKMAHEVWTELVTNLQISFDDSDIIIEIYDNWSSFFGHLRTIISFIPPSNNAQTKALIRILISIMKFVMKPHMTKWESKFRFWYHNALELDCFLNNSPQEIQQAYPNYKSLVKNLMEKQAHLELYSEELCYIIYSDPLVHKQLLNPFVLRIEEKDKV